MLIQNKVNHFVEVHNIDPSLNLHARAIMSAHLIFLTFRVRCKYHINKLFPHARTILNVGKWVSSKALHLIILNSQCGKLAYGSDSRKFRFS